MTAEDPKPIERIEQKLLFAQRYFVNRNDGVMIAAKILGDEAVANPMLAINFGNNWPFDPVVVEELARLDEVSRSKGRYEATAFAWAERCFQLGDSKVAHDLLKLAATVAGHMPTHAAKAPDANKSGDGHEEELWASIIDPDNRRDEPEQVNAKWQ